MTRCSNVVPVHQKFQDSSDDWAQESAHMSETYQNAFVTIAATITPDQEGCCFQIIPRDFPISKVPVGAINRNGSSVGVYTRMALPHPSVRYDEAQSNKDQFPLLTRAWVYQERLLSPRLLHFSSYELPLGMHGENRL